MFGRLDGRAVGRLGAWTVGRVDWVVCLGCCVGWMVCACCGCVGAREGEVTERAEAWVALVG